MKLSKPKENQIKEYINHSLSHTNLELEARIVPNFYSKITRDNFTDVIKRIKGYGLENITSSNNDSLDITIEKNNIRVSINGKDAINEYCITNDLNKIKKDVRMMEKKRFSNKGNELKGIDVKDFNFRLNLKEENNIKSTSRIFTNILTENQKLQKLFRYKKRFSFLSSDKIFRFDLTMIKSSSKKEIKINASQKAKKDINNRDKKLVKKPNNSQSFNDWWQSLSNTSMVNLRDNTYFKSLFFKNLEDSKTLENPLEYEIEVELVEKDKMNKNDIYEKLLYNLTIILQAINKNEFITSELTMKDVKKQFTSLTKFRKFNESIPLSVTLDYEKSMELDYEEYPNRVNIRNNYCVTEKADGERDLLFINGNGEIYLLNRIGDVKTTNCKSENLQNCLLDGEYITKDKEGNNIRLFMIFDIYFSNGRDLRELKFMRTKSEKEEGIGEKSRMEELEDLLKVINITKGSAKNEFMLELKNFLMGDELDFSIEKIDTIRKLEDIYRNTGEGIKELRKMKKDVKIFIQSNKIIEKIKEGSYIYNTDGLIFTPTNLTVGEGETKKNKYGGRWNRVFKWKPETENSIDLRVIFLKDEEGKILEGHTRVGNDIKIYYKTKLYCGYNPKDHNELNGLRIINEMSEYPNSYTMVPFEPLEPYVYNSSNCNLLSNLKCSNGDLIQDNSIVEFVYDKDEEINFRWKPTRVRDSVMPNAFSTALNVWNTTFNPLTTQMMITGNNIPDLCSKYYSEFKDRNSNMSKVARFHNLVKKYLIQSVAKENDTLLDLGSGEGGDLLKWIGVKLSLVVGIENNICNITNITKGACKRILQERIKNPKNELLKNIFLVWGDASKNLKKNDAGKDELNRYYLDVLWGNTISDRFINRYEAENMDRGRGVCADGFNVISSMFSMHYFFENKEKLFGFLQNLSENMKIGSQFIACLFDGSKIFEMLKSKDLHEQKDDNDNLCWSIRKKYRHTKLNNDNTSLGMTIGVYVNTFHKEVDEYLVNLNYLETILPKFGLQLFGKTDSFKKIYEGFSKGGQLKDELSDEGKLFSFLNVCIKIIKKENVMFGGGTKNSKDLINKFISSDFVEEEDLDDERDENEDDDEEEEEVEDEEEDEEVEEDEEEDEAIKEQNELEIDNLDLDLQQKGGSKELEIKELDLSDMSSNELEINELDLQQKGGSKELEINELDLSDMGSKELEINELDLQQKGGSKELEINELDLSDMGSKELEINELDLQQKGGSKELEINELDLGDIDLSDIDLSSNIDKESKNKFEFDNLESIDLGTKPEVLDLNVNNDNEINLGNENVKVIKISADTNTLNMINK